MKYLRMIWRVMTLDTRPMDADWRPMEGIMEDDEFDRDYEALGYTSGGKWPSIEDWARSRGWSLDDALDEGVAQDRHDTIWIP